MTDSILCDPYFWESPMVLFQTNFIFNTSTVCLSEHINHVVLLLIVLSVGGYASTYYFKYHIPIYVGVVLFLFFGLPSLLEIYKINTKKESFQNKVEQPSVSLRGEAIESALASSTYPTARNPFMNVLADEVRYNPGRPPAASVMDPSVKVSLDDFFKTEFSRDPTDVFGRSQSQREFITMPSTSIPNDVDSYQNWLYKIPGKTCKEGGREACLPGTDGYVPWMNVNN